MHKFNFDPIKVGTLEVGWWKAHHIKNKSLMSELLIKQNVELYAFTLQEAEIALKELVTGVNFHDTREWDKAIQATSLYFLKIKEKTNLDFNPQEIAETEVGWWQLHDKLENNPDKTELAETFTTLYSKMFGIDKNKLKIAGELKAEATKEHDLAEDSNTKNDEIEKHWNKAEELLINFYSELKNNIQI
jgi:hypothetical protein